MSRRWWTVALATSLGATLGGCASPAEEPENEGPGTTDIGPNIESGLVVAMAPEGLTGDFYFNDDLVCEASAFCEANVEGSIMVELKRPERMFLPKTAAGSKSGKTTVTWSDTEWGLAPDGLYRPAEETFTGPAYTELVNGKIHLVWDGNQLGVVVGNTFSGMHGDIEFSNGLISDDLSTISYTMSLSNGKISNRILHRVD